VEAANRDAEAGRRVRAVAQTLHKLANDLRTDSGSAIFADFTERGAEAIDRAGTYLEETRSETILADAEAFSRDRPLVVSTAGDVQSISGRALLVRRALVTSAVLESSYPPRWSAVRRPVR
jgi:hypothetical protein